ncbi:hypothetical protein [Aeromonas media]|nr:hypothetical protein [Aeromonas media]AHX60435.1 inosine-guanosine kinase [Aeromonas media WS]
MKFPGQRKSKHYFPVDRRDPLIPQNPQLTELGKAYVVVTVHQPPVDSQI